MNNEPHANHGGMPRIAFVSTMEGCPWGGSEWLWHATALSLRKQGCTVGVSVPRWEQTPEPVRDLAQAGCDVTFRARGGRKLRELARSIIRKIRSPRKGRADRAWLQRVDPDLVVISQGYPLEGIEWMIECRRLGIPYATIVQAAGELWWPEDTMLDGMRDAYIGAKAVCFVSRGNREVVEWQCGTRLENAVMVTNPWSDSVRGAVAWPDQENVVRIACVGRLDPRAKGQDLVLRLLALRQWKERKLAVDFPGAGPCRESLGAMARMLGVGNAAFPGHCDDIGTLWATRHALLLPSRYEGSPLVIHEAMLCGRPVITTDVAGNTSLLKDGANGFVIPAPTLPLLAETMERAWSLRERWRDMGRQARKDALEALPAQPAEDLARRLLGMVGAASTS